MATLEEFRTQFEGEFKELIEGLIPNADASVGTVLNELVIKTAADAQAERALFLENFRNNLSLAQVLAQDEPDEALLDNLLSNFNITRREGARATGTVNIFTQSEQRIYIPPTSLIICGDIILQPVKSFVGITGEIDTVDTDSVSYVQTRAVDENTRVFPITAVTVDNLETVLTPGQVCVLDPASNFVSGVEIASTFTGGAPRETNVQLLERASLGVNARILAGKDHIRALLTSSEEIDVLDVAVFGLGDTLQLRDADNNGRLSSGGAVDVYVKTAQVPSLTSAALTGERQADGRFRVEIPREDFPGAYGVEQIFSEENLINTEIETELGFVPDPSQLTLMSETIHARYSQFQTMAVLFNADNVDSATTEAVFQVDVLFMPGLDVVQDILGAQNTKNFSFDALSKAAIAVVVTALIEIKHIQGIAPPTTEAVRQEICDTVNGLTIGTEALLVSEIIAAAKRIFPEGEVQVPINLLAHTFLPDGRKSFSSSTASIKVAEDTGISSDNSLFACFPSDIEVTITEVPA